MENGIFSHVTFSNINEEDEYLAKKVVSFAYINYKIIFHSSTGFVHQRELNMQMTVIF